MSKYKVGDEVLIKAKITDVEPQDHYPYVVMTPTGQKTWVRDDDIAEVSEDEYNKGLQDAWELMRKIIEIYSKGVEGVLGRFGGPINEASRNLMLYIIALYTPQEALAKLEAYEKEQEQIKVGDVVEGDNGKGIAIKVWKSYGSIRLDVLTADNNVEKGEYACDWKKTGKHIDIASILAEIGKE